MFDMKGSAMVVVGCSARMYVSCTSVEFIWIAEYIKRGMKKTCDWPIADIGIEYSKITYLGLS